MKVSADKNHEWFNWLCVAAVEKVIIDGKEASRIATVDTDAGIAWALDIENTPPGAEEVSMLEIRGKIEIVFRPGWTYNEQTGNFLPPAVKFRESKSEE